MSLLITIALVAAQAATPPQQSTVSPEVEKYIKDHWSELQQQFERQRQIKALTNEQALIIYDQCLSRAAATLSHTSLPEDRIFEQARLRCFMLKVDLLNGSPPERFAQFKALDEQKAASFPALTKQLRQQRQSFENQTEKSSDAQNH